ncbi:MAG: ribonuclease G [Acidobacteria bacterium]|jgi:ribonuclease G|nr:MAG: ribonuclease G [Acidobacteriota bacterium]
MAKTLLILSDEDLALSFLADEREVQKVRVEIKNSPTLVDSIFKGRVKRYVKGMDGVFVDIGTDKDAYLPTKGKTYKIGESLIVQLVREPEENRGAKLTDKIKLVGKYLIYLPKGKDIKCSSRLASEEKEKLSTLLKESLKDEGIIVRSIAYNASYEELKEDLEKLRELWSSIEKRAKAVRKPKMLMEELPAHMGLIREHWYELEEIVTNDPELWSGISSFLEDFDPNLLKRNVYIKDPYTYMVKYRIPEVLNRLFSKVVWLKGGGYMVIDETEAFTVVDVNSGDPVGSCHEENALRTNLEAAQELARQIVLRDIGGIILVDFIDMKKQENKNLVISRLQEALGRESCYTTIYGFTKLGILEMVRKKRGRSVVRILSEPCKACGGKGYIKSSSLFNLKVQRELMSYPHKKVELCVHPLRYNSVKRMLEKKNLRYVELQESKELGMDSYSISHG